MDTKTINKINQLTKEQKKTIKLFYNEKTGKYQIYELNQKKINI